jgi:hypothetical protein
MELNLGVISIAVVLALFLLFFIIRRNLKDQKKLEEKIKKTDLGVDHHKGDKI